jgi:hypothetical protein
VAGVGGFLLVGAGIGVSQMHVTLDETPWQIGGAIGLSLAVVVAAVVWLAVRGTWYGLRAFVSFGAASLLALPAAGGGAAHLLNVELDDGKVVVHPTTVARTWVTRAKNGSTNHVSVRSWRRGEAEIELHWKMVRASWQPGDKVKVGVMPGAFGWAWIAWVR